MGEVWKAEHRMLARSAAIKLIRSDGGDSTPGHTPSSHLLRFEREAQATAQLRSPHTIHLYDFGITEDRTFYYVMELLEGLSLDELVSRYGPLPPGRAIRILRQVCHSLAEAHGKNLVHRDIKPANIYVCRYGQDLDFVKVLDFGLVKRAGEELERDLGITRIGAYIGTPAYGSPELASGSPETDIRSDIYSLGCVAFWLLTGRTVFRAPTLPIMLVKHINDAPDPPSRHAGFAVPPALDNLVLECLRKDKDERPASAAVLGHRLATIEVDQPWTDDSARRWWDTYQPPEQEADVRVLSESTEPLTVTKASI
jgi:serine/threonine-protein kinase